VSRDDLTEVQVPEDERMDPAEFRVIREYLGLTGDWVAGFLRVNPRTVRSWEQGRDRIPDGVRLRIEQMEASTAETVTSTIDALMDAPDPAVGTYRSDLHYQAWEPDAGWPASWHRAVIARVAAEVPGLVITYLPDQPPLDG